MTAKRTKKPAKPEVPADEKLERQDFDIFAALDAIDRKDYTYYSRLSAEQQRKFAPYLLLQWLVAVTGRSDLQTFYLLSADVVANKYFLNERVAQHPELQWLMLCAASPGRGKQYRKWIPAIKRAAQQLREPLTVREAQDYLQKLYPNQDTALYKQLAQDLSADFAHRHWLAERLPNMKLDDIETLSKIYTPEQARAHEQYEGK